jgi:uncharacterized membrane protein YGL010W
MNMKSLEQQLTMYAMYHRDPRNIATHFVGIPMIVFAVAILLSKPGFQLAGFTISPATVVVGLSCIYYLALNLRLGILMSVLFGICLYFAQAFGAMSTGAWLGWGLGLFFVGWVFQFVGHFYEGKKPAFVDDLTGLIIGPLFVVAELLFMLGMFSSLKSEVERGAGPVRLREAASA